MGENLSNVIMVSACLWGELCRYDGSSKPVAGLLEALAPFRVIPFCPEKIGGLTIPRSPAEIDGADGEAVLDGKARVIDRDGGDLTPEFIRGADKVLDMVRQFRPRLVILKANSPSCGAGRIYDGTFTGRLRDGNGVTAALLKRAKVPLATEKDYGRILLELGLDV